MSKKSNSFLGMLGMLGVAIDAAVNTAKNIGDTSAKVESEVQHKKQKNLIGTTRKIRGHTLFEYNKITGELSPAKYRPVSVMISGGDAGRH